MSDDEFRGQLRRAEAPVTPDPRFAEHLYAELTAELGLPASGERRASVDSDAARALRPQTRRLALLAAALLLVLLGLLAAVVGGRLVEPPRGSPGWPMFKGDASRRGEGVDGPIGQPVLRWRYQANGAIPESVSVSGGLAYASSDDGVLHALDVVTGEERWSFTADVPPLFGPAVVDGSVYVFDAAGFLHSLDAATGDLRWRSAQAVVGASSPTVGGGAVYAGSSDGSLVAIATADGTERWRSSISTTGVARSPAFADGRVYVAADGGGFVAVDAVDGTIVWRHDTGDLSTGTAVAADGIAFMGASGIPGEGMLWALDAATGVERWRIEQPIFTPAVSGGVAYSGSTALGVFAFDAATGRQRWTFPVAGAARPLAVADGTVYAPVTEERRVYALDAATGTERWRFDVDAPINCCVAVAEGAAHVGTQLGGLYAIAGSETPTPSKD
jgi:outer membrane protein assembly factor BamB